MTHGLWRDHEAIPRQQRLMLNSGKKHGRPTQAALPTAMLRGARARGRPLELPEVDARQGSRSMEHDSPGQLRTRGFVSPTRQGECQMGACCHVLLAPVRSRVGRRA